MMLQGVRQYLAESWCELKKRSWATRQIAINLTLIVLVVATLVGAYIGGFDLALIGALDLVLR